GSGTGPHRAAPPARGEPVRGERQAGVAEDPAVGGVLDLAVSDQVEPGGGQFETSLLPPAPLSDSSNGLRPMAGGGGVGGPIRSQARYSSPRWASAATVSRLSASVASTSAPRQSPVRPP